MGKIIYFFRGLLAYALRFLTKWIPRDEKKWAFGAKNSFRDNPKYLFLWTIENHPEIKAIWISQNKKDVLMLREKGLKAYYWLSLSGIWVALTAKVYVCDHSLCDVNIFLSGGVFYVNLWHGVSVKRVRWQDPQLYVKSYKLNDACEMRNSFFFKMCEYPDLFVNPDFLLVPSKIQSQDFFAPMHNVSLENCVLGIPPRSRLLLKNKNEVLDFIRKYEPTDTLHLIDKISGYKKVYIYMPTWRYQEQDFLSESKINWRTLDDALKKSDSILLLRFHMFTKVDVSDIGNCENILLYPQMSDIYTVLPFVDCLITDYSSIYTDFLTMNKEIILFVYDYELYTKRNDNLDEYNKYYLAKRVKEFGQLVTIIESKEDCHVPEDLYNYSMEYFWDNNIHDIDIIEEIKKSNKIK